jgi:predicted acetyltransferase
VAPGASLIFAEAAGDPMIQLDERPRLRAPTTAVRVSYLVGEQADCVLREKPTDWLTEASADFEAYVAERAEVRHRWGVPYSTFWYVSGPYYIGSLVIRHELTPQLLEAGGHIGYHVVAPWLRQGHATRMLGEGLDEARKLGLERVLLTCLVENEPSRRVILANGGVRDGQACGEDRFWIDLA